jgi:GT2 family glycosyltransferase
VKKARGEYVALIDSDMELTPDVIGACVEAMDDDLVTGIVIPEESFGEGFWAKCKRLERSFYVGVPWIEAARFFKRSTYQELGGYDETLVSGEDWDLSRRVGNLGKLASVQEAIRHNEGRLSLWQTVKKKYYYAQHARAYLETNVEKSVLTAQAGPLRRYGLFFSDPRKLLSSPGVGLGMLFMKTGEFLFGALGYMTRPRIQAVDGDVADESDPRAVG